ncbi:hypothetical protein ACPCVL_12050 [Streptomyces koyangensis]|uniref:hypothetical protein n=1 Tax=Streptomyces koyangensis TaxID=188770 RepID=UPI003C2D840D
MQLLRALSAPGLLEERAPGTFAGTAVVLPHGGERTREEFAEVCRRAGLALTSVIPLPEAAPYHLIEAVAG